MLWGVEVDGGGYPAGEAEIDVENAEDSDGDEHVFCIREVGDSGAGRLDKCVPVGVGKGCGGWGHGEALVSLIVLLAV